MSQEEHYKRKKNSSELVGAFIEELAKVDKAGREGVEWELSYWIKTILPLLKAVRDIVNDDLSKYWQMLRFLSTMDAFIKPAQRYKTEELFNVLSKLPQNKADFILGKIDDIASPQLKELQLYLSNKEKDGFIRVLRQTKYESICPQCWALRYYYYMKFCLNADEKEREELLYKAQEKGLVSGAEQSVIDVIYNKIVDCHNHFFCKYDSDKRYIDGVFANILLAIALTLRQESYDYFLVYMHKIGVKIYYCVVWLFLERKDSLSRKDYDAIYSILHDSHPMDFSYVSRAYSRCDNPAELDECKRQYCEILDINNHDTMYSYFNNEEFSDEYGYYKMPQLDISARYILDIRGSIWHHIMESYLSVSFVIPKEELINAQRQLENDHFFNGKCFLLPCNQNDGGVVLQDYIPTIETNKWQLPVEFFDKSYLDDCDIDEYIPCFLEEQITIDTVVNEKLPELKLRLNVAFQEFIETLAVNGCIDNDYITKASFAHALTGRKVDVRIKKVKWKYSQSTKDKGWLDNICHIASELYPRYIIDKNHGKLKKFDHINKVFDLDYDSLTPEIYQKINPDKFGSSYGYNADKFVKRAVEKFLNSVEIIKISIGA